MTLASTMTTIMRSAHASIGGYTGSEEDIEDNDEADDASDDSAECLRELLGGISFENIPADAWDCPAAAHDDELKGAAVTTTTQPVAVSPQTSSTPIYLHHVGSLAAHGDKDLYTNAFRSLPDRICPGPAPVQIIAIPGRGNGLIATTDISKGTVIYTERAFLAAQQAFASVRACQNCFRSLESIDKVLADDSSPLPLPDFWPVPPLCYSQLPQNDSILTDDCGRVTCRRCDSLFCSKLCYTQFNNDLGSCCASNTVLGSIDAADELALALAIRLFAYSLQLHQTDGGLKASLLLGLCGDADDVTSLELGVFNGQSSTYSLQALYNEFAAAYNMTSDEKSVLSLDLLHKFAAMAARNGVGLMTQSPFKQYYAAVLRSTGGRGSAQHDAIKTRVALALGSDDGVLQRGMDRDMDELVAPHISALFLLTARINHSCAPNASIQSQVFCDAHMDLVALRDIYCGEEITISYIGTGHGMGRKSTSRRRRELQSKYLFFCECTECTNIASI